MEDGEEGVVVGVVGVGLVEGGRRCVEGGVSEVDGVVGIVVVGSRGRGVVDR